ncbi:iron-uptake system-binding protein [Paenibacillus sp. FSL A5-0031]|uniref:ABC transporter substrate-binding protein n=1 Tax=Paenibacillus sp. FSL A5-0031 TaxID=1920420 RepID=UPI00096F2E6D|nr:ABC transporter substrate-binding protein [Paenibacillus sp. FSL A5-0031]OME85150.1 iron-uptake system-binding protein [Paenibacillus sp. FSL A5-0031]
MKKKGFLSVIMAIAIAVMITACGGNSKEEKAPANGNGAAANTEKQAGESNNGAKTEKPASEEAATRKITYLDQEYELPAKVERIVIVGAVEAMEDSIILDVKPVGAISFGGVFPPMFESITKDAVSIGEKMEPNFEAILSLKPDVILGSTKFPAEVSEKLATIAPTILYSHISTNWEANLKLLGELGGKEAQAEEAIAKYKVDLDAARASLGDKLKDQKVVVVRIRQGQMFVYPEKVFFNPIIYSELGLTAPAEIKAAKAQEALSVEKFAEMNPDYLFIQFSQDENKDTPNALEDLQANPIMKNTKAIKEGKAFVNIVDPLAQGGTAYSKIVFLKAVAEHLNK